MRNALLVIAVIALIGFLVIAFVIPEMRGAEAQEAAQQLLAGAEPAKQQVASAAQKAGNLAGSGKGLKIAARNDAKHGEMKWIVSEGGAIRGWNEQNVIEISLTPALQGGKLGWTCRGYPVAAMPASCGGR